MRKRIAKVQAVLNTRKLHRLVHRVRNKMLNLRYSARFWICLEFWIYQCCAGFCRKQPVIHVWQVSEYFFWVFLSISLISEYTMVLIILGFWICLCYARFWIKYFVIDVWQYYEYALDFEYVTVLNMLGLREVVNKIFHYKYLKGFWMCLEFWIYQCYTGFCRKERVIHVWQVSEYSLDSG